MKFFIVFAVALAVTAAEDYQPDSQDVAAAKLAHFVEKAKAAAAVGAEPDYITSYYINYYKNYAQGGQSNYIPAAPITVLPSGYLADTPEVSAAKTAHFAEQAKAAYAAGAPTFNYYNIPTGSVLPNGYLADTPEVAAAKASFFSEYSRAAASAN